MRVTVLTGGDADERNVALATGAQVADALRTAGHQVMVFDTARGLVTPAGEAALREKGVDPHPPARRPRDLLVEGGVAVLEGDPLVAGADVFFLAMHGGAGEDGTVQRILDEAGLVYTGSDPEACRIAMDKDRSKARIRDAGVPTPDWLVDAFDPDEVEDRLGLPVIVKAAHGGSSLRLELAHDRAELEAALGRARGFMDAVIVERYVSGREFTVAVLDGRPLPVGEIIPSAELFDYASKYQPGGAREIFPADLSEAEAADVEALGLRVHRALGLRDYSRVDFMRDGEGGFWCLEANNLPGLTAASLVPKAAAAAGISFPELCDQLVQTAARRRGRGPEPAPTAGV
ncbi:MAG TPA: D-alanine--D-alanine ligase [Longimicrobiales bacterium]|nr:D-alanine--D-alanine ligase [Longimicrobiales bacterium]